eukprot:s3128_g3.t1
MRLFSVLLSLIVVQDGYFLDFAETVSQTACTSQKPLVAGSNCPAAAYASATQVDLYGVEPASFTGSLAAAAHTSKDTAIHNGDLGSEQCFRAALVLQKLPDHAKGPCGALRSVWPILEGCSRPKLRLQWWTKTAVPTSRRRTQGTNNQQRQPSRQVHKGQGRGQGKGLSPRSDMPRNFALPPPQPDPPWNMASVAMPMMPTPPPPLGPSVQQDPQLAELIAMISKNPDNCPPEVQAAFHALQARNAQKESKLLHSAVTQMTKAKQELADAQLHRSNLHSSWIKFLQESIAKWQECGQQFREQEEAAVARIKTAQASYTAACDALNCSKREAGVAGAEEVVDVEEIYLSGVSTVNSTKICESLANLQTTLSELHQSAEELAAQDSHTAKRPRLEPAETNTSPDGLPAFSGSNSQQAKSPAMEPFGVPGQK